MIIFPSVVLWRVYWHRRMLTRIPGYRPTATGRTLLPVIAVLMTMIAILWLIVSPTLKIGNELPEQGNSIQTQQVVLQKSEDHEQFVRKDLFVILKPLNSSSNLSPEKDSSHTRPKSVPDGYSKVHS